jgi:hypothetical protein
LSCALCCAALSLKNNSNQRICGRESPQQKGEGEGGLILQIRKFRGVAFQLLDIKPWAEAQQIKEQLQATGKYARIVKPRRSDTPNPKPGYFCIWVADRELAPKAAGKKGE